MQMITKVSYSFSCIQKVDRHLLSFLCVNNLQSTGFKIDWQDYFFQSQVGKET